MKRSMRRIVSAITATVLLLSVGYANLFASSNGSGKIDGFSGERGLEDTYSIGQSNSSDYTGWDVHNTYNIEVYPGEEVRIPLTADMFTWDNEKTPLPLESLKLSDLRRSKVTVRTQNQSGSKVLDYVQFDTDVFGTGDKKPFFSPGSALTKTGKTAYISVMFAEEFVSVKEAEFAFDIYVAIDGRTDDDMRITLQGVMRNNELQTNAETDYANTADGTVIDSSDLVRNMTVDLGKGLTIERIILPKKKYYATVAIKPASDPGFEQEFPDVYPSVVAAYVLQTVNMRYGKSDVTIKPADGKEYFVYGEDMTYLGKTTETLRYSDYYFLSTEEIPSFEVEKYLELVSTRPSTLAVADYDSGEDSAAEYAKDEQNATGEVTVDGKEIAKAEKAAEAQEASGKREDRKNMYPARPFKKSTNGVDESPNVPTKGKKAEDDTTIKVIYSEDKKTPETKVFYPKGGIVQKDKVNVIYPEKTAEDKQD